MMERLAARSQGNAWVIIKVAGSHVRGKFKGGPGGFRMVKFGKSREAGRPVEGFFRQG
jgi:hypothetical protein